MQCGRFSRYLILLLLRASLFDILKYLCYATITYHSVCRGLYFLIKRSGYRFKVIFISSNKVTVSNVGTSLKLQSESGSVILYLFRLRLQEKLPTPINSESSFGSDSTTLAVTVACVFAFLVLQSKSDMKLNQINA